MSKKLNTILTGFQGWPFGSFETDILELNTCLIENETSQLGTATEIEVMKFVGRHIELLK
jgi:hypothetical protein